MVLEILSTANTSASSIPMLTAEKERELVIRLCSENDLKAV
jgi:hypothetical protein